MKNYLFIKTSYKCSFSKDNHVKLLEKSPYIYQSDNPASGEKKN